MKTRKKAPFQAIIRNRCNAEINSLTRFQGWGAREKDGVQFDRMPGKANLTMYQGDDYAAAVTVNGPDGKPADLTGWEAEAHIRTGPADTSPNIAAKMVLLVAGGVVTMGLHAADTEQLTGQYQWDLQMTSPGGARVTLLAGYVNVTPEVTRLPPVTRKP